MEHQEARRWHSAELPSARHQGPPVQSALEQAIRMAQAKKKKEGRRVEWLERLQGEV
jgi:hypothetical protein